MRASQLELNVPKTTEKDLRRRNSAGEADGRPPEGGDGEGILRRNPMMRHLLEALERRESIGHYGRLVFAMVGHHFLEGGRLRELLARDPEVSVEDAGALERQVRERDYNPPRPERIAEWQRSQSFPICPEGDPRACNVYRDLRFPPEVYAHIRGFYEEKNAPREERRSGGD